ncbi:MAG: GerMN domain-containing protein [Acidimicrobiales bacterium]
MTTLVRRVAWVAALAVGAAACSLPTDDSAQIIDQEELSPSLQNVTTTITTTQPPAASRDFAYYLLANREGTDQRVVQQVVVPITANSPFEAIDPMDTEGFRASIGADDTLLNTVTQYDIVNVTVDDGVATVFLETLEDVPGDTALRDVAAQLVWTLTGEDGIEAMLINIDGLPKALSTTNGGSATEAPVRTTDFGLYDASTEATTSTSSSTSTTTVPPGDG